VFDISFGEMMVVGVVALVVIGPERLPKVARTVGSFVGKAQRYATQVRNDINAQIELEELRKTQQEIRDAAQQFEQSISQEIKAAETEVAHIHQQVDEIRADLNQIEAAKTESGSGQSPSVAELNLPAQMENPDVDAEEQALRNQQMDLFANRSPDPTTSAKSG
jgi:sec-independent protein translocase protein TatB